MHGIFVRIAQINHQRVFLLEGIAVQPAAVCIPHGVAAEVTYQDLLGLLLSLGLCEDGLVGVLVVGDEIEDVLGAAVDLGDGRLGNAVLGQVTQPVKGPGLEHVLQTVLAVLAGGLEPHVHTDNALVRDVNHALDEGAADEAVAARADIDLEVVILQIVHDFNHGGVEGSGTGNATIKAHRVSLDGAAALEETEKQVIDDGCISDGIYNINGFNPLIFENNDNDSINAAMLRDVENSGVEFVFKGVSNEDMHSLSSLVMAFIRHKTLSIDDAAQIMGADLTNSWGDDFHINYGPVEGSDRSSIIISLKKEGVNSDTIKTSRTGTPDCKEKHMKSVWSLVFYAHGGHR